MAALALKLGKYTAWWEGMPAAQTLLAEDWRAVAFPPQPGRCALLQHFFPEVLHIKSCQITNPNWYPDCETLSKISLEQGCSDSSMVFSTDIPLSRSLSEIKNIVGKVLSLLLFTSLLPLLCSISFLNSFAISEADPHPSLLSFLLNGNFCTTCSSYKHSLSTYSIQYTRFWVVISLSLVPKKWATSSCMEGAARK